MKSKPADYEKDLDEFRKKHPSVWVDAVSPEDMARYAEMADIEVPDDWNDPLFLVAKEHIQSNFDSEFGLTIADIQESIAYARTQ